MARIRSTTRASGRSVLLIDDNAEYLRASSKLLERDGHETLSAASGAEALRILRSRRVDLVLVDYHMPGMNGDEFIRELRAFDPTVQVILQTGYAGEHPPRDMLRQLDIQGYHDKADGPEKLRLWVDVGLKAAYSTQLLERSRLGLRYILGVTPELHKLQPLEELLQGILLQTAGLLGATHSLLAVVPEPADNGFVAMVHDGGDFTVRACTGRFRASARLDECITAEHLKAVSTSLASGRAATVEGAVVTPLRVAGACLGLIYLERPLAAHQDTELLEIFANQAAVAIQNTALYELAALDPLTGAQTRRFFMHALHRELRQAHRSGTPLGLVMVDLDGMKSINDGAGHLAGDAALRAAAQRLRGATRATDIVGRLGGDEFALLLPGTNAQGVAVVLERVEHAFSALSIAASGTLIRVGASVGASVLDGDKIDVARPQRYFEVTALDVLEAADQQLYHAKRSGRAPPCVIPWPSEQHAHGEPSSRSAAIAAPAWHGAISE